MRDEGSNRARSGDNWYRFMPVRGKISGRLGAKESHVASDSCLPRHEHSTMTNQQAPGPHLGSAWAVGGSLPGGALTPGRIRLIKK